MNPAAYFSRVYNQHVLPDESRYQPGSSGKTLPPGIYVDTESYSNISDCFETFLKNASN
jgi:hypothetical protein